MQSQFQPYLYAAKQGRCDEQQHGELSHVLFEMCKLRTEEWMKDLALCGDTGRDAIGLMREQSFPPPFILPGFLILTTLALSPS